jgi:hypothetical protein
LAWWWALFLFLNARTAFWVAAGIPVSMLRPSR